VKPELQYIQLAHPAILVSFKLNCMKITILIILTYLSVCPVSSAKDTLESRYAFQKTDFPNYLRLPIEGEICTIDPGISLDTASVEVTEQLFLGLTEYDYVNSTYTIVPEIADNWTINEKGTVYRFQLRKDIYWVNGKNGKRLAPVTSYDFVRSIQRNLNPELDAPYVSVLFILKNAKAIHSGKIKDISRLGVHAIDDYSLEFILEYPAIFFPSMLALWIYRPLPVSLIEKFGKDWTLPQHIQTNGPYMLQDWKKHRKMILTKNPHFYAAKKVSIPEIHYIILPESFVAFDMYFKGDLDIIGGSYIRLPPSKIGGILKNNAFRRDYSTHPMFAIYSYQFNTMRHPVDNPLVRKAISAAINRQLLIKIVTKAGQLPANTLTPNSFLGEKNVDHNIFDPEQAKLWLTEAGYPDGKGFPELKLFYDTSDMHLLIARAIKVFLKHFLNIELSIQSMEWQSYMRCISQSDKSKVPHIFRFGWTTDYLDANNWLNDAFYYFQSLNSWSNKQYDQIILKAAKCTNAEERYLLYQQAEHILIQENASVLPIFFESAQYLVQPRINGWYHMPVGGQHIDRWSFK